MDAQLERRAEAIFDTLLDVPTVDRPARAAAACGDDAALLDRVRVLLASLPAADGFLSGPTMDAGATTGFDAPTGVSAADLAERAGTVVGGRYKLLQQIGEGGFGVVFLAEQQVPVRRQVALKVIKLGMDTREVVARFEAERQALALMDHPNIAKVLDAGSTDAGRPYFVMELVRGLPVTEYADKHKLSPADRVALLAQVCRAVQHAHGKGVIHRDLKPSNVLVTTGDGDRPVPKVIDFGIAKATQSKLTDRTLFTQFRQLIGTPQYMSPEQADSEGVDVDTRSDVYSLGVLLYELLVGVTPLDARALRSAAFEAMRRMIRDDEVPRPSTRLHTMAADTVTTLATNRSTDARHLGQVVRGELDWIVMRALEKDRSRRYDTAAALADDLGRYLAGDAVQAGPVSGLYRLRKLARRYRAAVAVGGVVAACLLLGVAGTTFGLVQARRQSARAEATALVAAANERRALAGEREARAQKAAADANAQAAGRAGDLARAKEKQARDEQVAAKATLDFLTQDVLAQASPYNANDDRVSRVLVDKLIMPALAKIGQRFKGQPLVRAAVQDTLAQTLNDLGRYDLALPQAKAAWDARRAGLGEDARDTLGAMFAYGSALNGLHRYAEAADVFKQAWDAFRRVRGDDDRDTLGAMVSYGTALYGLGRHAEAADVYKRAWDGLRRVRGDDSPDTLAAMMNYGSAQDGLHRYAEAADVYKQAWAGFRRVRGDDGPDTLAAMVDYGRALYGLHRYAEAADVLKQAWDGCRRVLGDDHPTTRGAWGNYAAAMRALGRPVEVRPATRPAGAGATTRPADAADPAAAVQQGVALMQSGHSAAAVPLLRRAADYYRQSAPDDADRGPALYFLGSALAGEHQWADAEAVLRENWAFDQSHPAPDRKVGTVPGSLRLLNQVLKAEGKPAEATTGPATRP